MFFPDLKVAVGEDCLMSQKYSALVRSPLFSQENLTHELT